MQHYYFFPLFISISLLLFFIGCNVVIASRKLDRLDETAASIRKSLPESKQSKLLTMKCNIRNEQEVTAII